jgi:hypothetical protein
MWLVLFGLRGFGGVGGLDRFLGLELWRFEGGQFGRCGYAFTRAFGCAQGRGVASATRLVKGTKTQGLSLGLPTWPSPVWGVEWGLDGFGGIARPVRPLPAHISESRCGAHA